MPLPPADAIVKVQSEPKLKKQQENEEHPVSAEAGAHGPNPSGISHSVQSHSPPPAGSYPPRQDRGGPRDGGVAQWGLEDGPQVYRTVPAGIRGGLEQGWKPDH